MARPQKNNADYFSHDNDMRDDEKIKAVRRKFSHIGYAIWNMLLEKLCRAKDFEVEYSEDSLDLMAGDFGIEPEQLKEIIDYLIKLKLIIQENNIIYSKTMITRFEGLFRKRKRDTEKLSLAITDNSGVIAGDNPQSKVKETIVKEIKENKKEKGVKENPPFSFNFSSKSFLNENLADFKKLFEKQAPNYVWEKTDEEHLFFLLEKILRANPELKTGELAEQAFENFLQGLPAYWRNKKFTLPNLNKNFNEIISEMSADKKTIASKIKIQSPVIPIVPEKTKTEPSAEEKKELLKKMLPSIAESFEIFVSTGKIGFLPYWAMYDALVQSTIFLPCEKELAQYRNEAFEKRKAELNNPKNSFEQKLFSELLAAYEANTLPENEKNTIEKQIKSLAVKTFFEKLKSQNKNLKTLINH